MDCARAIVQKGLKNGADSFALYLSLADVYERVSDLDGAEVATREAIRLRPGSRYDYGTLMRLADLETRAEHFDRAALWMRQAAEIRPDSADVLYQLAQVEERDYEFGQSLNDLARALKLAPDNVVMRNHYRDLRRMIAAHSDHRENEK
jgi:tetratricopeptide (TPR) repeat protein